MRRGCTGSLLQVPLLLLQHRLVSRDALNELSALGQLVVVVAVLHFQLLVLAQSHLCKSISASLLSHFGLVLQNLDFLLRIRKKIRFSI